MANEDPKNARAQEELADCIFSQGYVLDKSKDPAGALSHYDLAEAAYKKLMSQHPGNFPPGLRTTYQLMAVMALKTGDAANAIANAQKQLEIDDRFLALNASNASVLRNRGVAFLQLGKASDLKAKNASGEARIAHWRDARAWYERSLEVWNDQQKKGTLVAGYLSQRESAVRAIEKCDRNLNSLKY